MKVLVTGGSGFVGWHLVQALLRRGDQVRCLVRPGSLPLLRGQPVEIVPGDLTDEPSVRRGVQGVEGVYHCAADYRLFVPDPAAMYAPSPMVRGATMTELLPTNAPGPMLVCPLVTPS